MKRIVDEQYQRGMKLLRDNMYLLDELAKMLMEQEKVSGLAAEGSKLQKNCAVILSSGLVQMSNDKV